MAKAYTLKELAFRVQLPEALVARYLRLNHEWQGYTEEAVEFVREIHERGLTRFERLLDRVLTILDLIVGLHEMLDEMGPLQGTSLRIEAERSHSKREIAKTIGVSMRELNGVIKEFEAKYRSLRKLGRGYDSASAWALKVYWQSKQFGDEE